MNEALKNRIVIIQGVLLVIFFFGALSSCNSAIWQKSAHDKERSARLALEERTSKYVQEKAAIEEKVKAMENQIQELKVALEATSKALVQDQLVNQSLKEELQKVIKVKEGLDEELKQASVDGKKLKK